MSEPTFTETTERTYGRLPITYRVEDTGQDYQLKKWLSGSCDQLWDIEHLLNRFSYVPPQDGVPVDTSDLVDPNTADAAWLPWLAQLVGVQLDTTVSIDMQRAQIANVDFLQGTKQSMAKTGQTVLTGTQYIRIFDHTSASTDIGGAGEWDVLIITVASETTSSPSAAIIAAGAKPAGVQLHEETFTSTWDDVEGRYPTWADWDAATWQQIEESGL